MFRAVINKFRWQKGNTGKLLSQASREPIEKKTFKNSGVKKKRETEAGGGKEETQKKGICATELIPEE